MSMEEVTLEPPDRKILDLAVDHEFDRGTPISVNEVLLTYPPEAADFADDSIAVLVAAKCLTRSPGVSGDLLNLTHIGLRTSTCRRAAEAAAFAERLLNFLKTRAEREKGEFTHYTWTDLNAAIPAVVTDVDGLALALSVIRLLKLSGGNDVWGNAPTSAKWSVPEDIPALRTVADIHGLRARAERLLGVPSAPQGATESLALRRSRDGLLDVQRSLDAAALPGRFESVAPLVSQLADDLPPCDLRRQLRGNAIALAQSALSDFRRAAALRGAAAVCRRLHREAGFQPSPLVEDEHYASFLRAAVHEDGKLPCGVSISVRSIEKHARLPVPELHFAIARALDEELAYVSDIDDQAYSIQVNHEELEFVLRELLVSSSGRASPRPSAVKRATPAVILFLAANPSSTDRIGLDEEARDIEVKIRSAAHRESLAFRTRWAVRPDDLLQALNEDRPTVVHFSGHGAGLPGIVLHDDHGGAQFVAADALRHLFETFRDDIRVVFLNACYSEEQATAIASVVDCVVGMRDSVDDDAARVFAASFYRALGFGRSVKNAFEQGKLGVRLAGLPDDGTPELFLRTGVNAEEVFIIHP